MNEINVQIKGPVDQSDAQLLILHVPQEGKIMKVEDFRIGKYLFRELVLLLVTLCLQYLFDVKYLRAG